MRHCATCHCGLTEVEWSDRGGWVDLKNPEDVARIVIACSLDHSYDRTANGVPHGIPREMEVKLAPVVKAHLSAINPNWEDETVFGVSDEQREAFRLALIAAVAG